ncbi:alpha/beta fold hydrolase [Sphingorhabdus sp. Alg231-15]|uniref:alpha/beta fold hydrolase n=1 Tax=Sphingorhabdus sp. Alg231-15 TaxID=1922222 RepID=UPI000D553F62
MITRHFIDIDHSGNIRRVHYRKAGSGPPLLMVHQSPRSSKEYEALMEKWAAHFTCIAPDTPGFGQSDPLSGHPEIVEYADAVIDFLDALGIKKCAAYGFHSGGIILVTAVKRHPSRITTLAVGGYAIWTPEEMALFSDRYLPEFHPSDYGEHLTWLWNRILEQSWFFPWFATDDAHRLSVANDDPARVDAIVREMLDAGNAYQAGYGAVLRAPRDIPAVDADVPPCLISAYDGDPLQEHIDRLGQMPASWNAQKVATPADHQAVSLSHLLVTETPMVDHLPEASDEGFVAIHTKGFDGLIHWRGDRTGDKLDLHAPSYAVAGNQPAGQIAIDLPGHGLSDNWADDTPVTWASWDAVIAAVAGSLGTSEIVYPTLPIGEPEKLYPDLSPDRFGNYLNMAWQIVRARHMFAPWYTVDTDHAVAFDEQHLEPGNLAAEHLALINGHSARQYHIALQSRQKEN